MSGVDDERRTHVRNNCIFWHVLGVTGCLGESSSCEVRTLFYGSLPKHLLALEGLCLILHPIILEYSQARLRGHLISYRDIHIMTSNLLCV